MNAMPYYSVGIHLAKPLIGLCNVSLTTQNRSNSYGSTNAARVAYRTLRHYPSLAYKGVRWDLCAKA